MDHNPIANRILVRLASSVFTLVVLKDAILLSFLDALPVCLEGDVEHGISAKDKLRRSCLVCGVDGGIDCASHCAENSSPAKFDGQIVFVVDVCCTNEIVQGLMDPFHDGISLWISSGNDLTGQSILVFQGGLDFRLKLFTPVHDYFRRPWVSGEPGELKDVDYIVRLSRRNEFQVEPSRCGIDHRETVKGNIVPYAIC